MQTTLALLFIV